MAHDEQGELGSSGFGRRQFLQRSAVTAAGVAVPSGGLSTVCTG